MRAECVETADQLSWPIASGCEFAQGFYFGAPMDEKQLLAHLATAVGRPKPQRRSG